MILEGHTEVLDREPWLFPPKFVELLMDAMKWSTDMAEFLVWHWSAESPTDLKQSVRNQKVCSPNVAFLWPMSCLQQQPAHGVLGKVMPLTPAPAVPTLPPPEQLATILGSLICCTLSSQNICLKKDQIFISHLCILLKGEMRLVMIDKC